MTAARDARPDTEKSSSTVTTQQQQQIPTSKRSQYPTEGVTNPCEHDVLCGRGGGTNNHPGNKMFRKLVDAHKMRYLAATKVDKPKVAREVVKIWREKNPPGRFLARTAAAAPSDKKDDPAGGGGGGNSGHVWHDVGDKKAREKASQCLRERTPDVVSALQKLQAQQAHLAQVPHGARGGAGAGGAAGGARGGGMSPANGSHVPLAPAPSGGRRVVPVQPRPVDDHLQPQMSAPILAPHPRDTLVPKGGGGGQQQFHQQHQQQQFHHPGAEATVSSSAAAQAAPNFMGDQFIVASRATCEADVQEGGWAFPPEPQDEFAQPMPLVTADQAFSGGAAGGGGGGGAGAGAGAGGAIPGGAAGALAVGDYDDFNEMTLDEYQHSLREYMEREVGLSVEEAAAAANVATNGQYPEYFDYSQYSREAVDRHQQMMAARNSMLTTGNCSNQSTKSIETFSMASTANDAPSAAAHSAFDTTATFDVSTHAGTHATGNESTSSFEVKSGMFTEHSLGRLMNGDQCLESVNEQGAVGNGKGGGGGDGCGFDDSPPLEQEGIIEPLKDHSAMGDDRSQKMRLAKAGGTGTSGRSHVSMFSDVSDFTSGGLSKQKAPKDDLSMMSELTDLSTSIRNMDLASQS